MQAAFPYRILEQQLWLSADRTIFWEEEKTLITSDCHFGKTGHFRKSGIAVPQAVYKEDLQRLVVQIQYFQPSQLIVVGDLFHSQHNKELELFQRWREDFPHLVIHLVKGNHDILHDDWYRSTGIGVSNLQLLVNRFQFIHDIEDGFSEDEEAYSFSGHIHPGIRINGMAKQSLCFGRHYAVLPAFSRFTGVATIQPGRNENVFAIVKDQIVQIQ